MAFEMQQQIKERTSFEQWSLLKVPQDPEERDGEAGNLPGDEVRCSATGRLQRRSTAVNIRLLGIRSPTPQRKGIGPFPWDVDMRRSWTCEPFYDWTDSCSRCRKTYFDTYLRFYNPSKQELKTKC